MSGTALGLVDKKVNKNTKNLCPPGTDILIVAS